MRGKAKHTHAFQFRHRITPACAGKRLCLTCVLAILWDHPRMCGEKEVLRHGGRAVEGSPPHVRGKVACKVQAVCYEGITPACAGKRGCPHSGPGTTRDHPRVCGEKFVRNACSVIVWGSPPRMRGKGICFRLEKRPRGITPACAGKSDRWHGGQSCPRDHPRMCGEKFDNPKIDNSQLGSPPRMRGKAFKLNICLFHLGITPAYAGKSRTSGTGGSGRRDHPRVCGEKAGRCPGLFRATGSPPRMRGKAYDEEHVPYGERITPAYAGKSTIISHRAYLRRDHPRVCGEKVVLLVCTT